MNLEKSHKKEWINGMLKIFSSDDKFKGRLEASMPLYGLRWAMIVLNEFLPDIIAKRINASKFNFLKKETIFDNQLKKAKNYCNQVMKYT